MLRKHLQFFFWVSLVGLLLLEILHIGLLTLRYSINSDSLYLLSVYHDLFVDGFSLSGWFLSPAPCFFPDWLLYFPLLHIIPDYGWGYSLYGFVYIGICGVAVFDAARFVSDNSKRSLAYVLVTLIFLLAMFETFNGMKVAESIWVPGRHAGILLPGMILLTATWRWVEKGLSWGPPCFLFVLLFLSLLSDVLIIPQFVLPLIASLFILALQKQLSRKAFAAFCALFVCAYLLSTLLLSAWVKAGFFSMTIPPYPASYGLSDAWQRFGIFCSDMRDYFYKKPLFYGAMAVWLTASMVFLFQHIRIQPQAQPQKKFLVYVCCFSLFSIAGNVAAVVGTGLWYSHSEFRYITPLFTLPIFTLSLLMLHYHEIVPTALRYALLLIILLFAAMRTYPVLTELNGPNFAMPYPDRVQFIDDVAQKYGLKYGYSDYWNAKYTQILSRRKLRVNQVNKGLLFYFTINNKDWYWKTDPHENSSFPEYTFIVTNRLDTERIIQRFGPPAAIERSGDTEIYIYNRREDVAFRQFLRYFFLTLENSKEGALRPLQPSHLRAHKPDGTPIDSQGCSFFQKGSAAIEFLPQPGRNVLEISLDRNDEYRVDLFDRNPVDPKRIHLGSVVLPASSGEGLLSHYILLSEDIIHQSIAFVTVTPVRGDGRYSVGHVLLYKDSRQESQK